MAAASFVNVVNASHFRKTLNYNKKGSNWTLIQKEDGWRGELSFLTRLRSRDRKVSRVLFPTKKGVQQPPSLSAGVATPREARILGCWPPVPPEGAGRRPSIPATSKTPSRRTMTNASLVHRSRGHPGTMAGPTTGGTDRQLWGPSQRPQGWKRPQHQLSGALDPHDKLLRLEMHKSARGPRQRGRWPPKAWSCHLSGRRQGHTRADPALQGTRITQSLPGAGGRKRPESSWPGEGTYPTPASLASLCHLKGQNSEEPGEADSLQAETWSQDYRTCPRSPSAPDHCVTKGLVQEALSPRTSHQGNMTRSARSQNSQSEGTERAPAPDAQGSCRDETRRLMEGWRMDWGH